MKVSQISHFQNKINSSYAKRNHVQIDTISMPIQNNSYANSLDNVNSSYGKALVGMKNTPSFGAFGIDDLVVLLVAFSPLLIVGGCELASIISSKYDTKAYKEQRLLQEAEIKNVYNNEITKLANTLNISPKKAEKIHKQYLAASFIKPNGKADQEIGMNAVRGYGMEKYKLMKDLLSPVVLAQKATEKAIQTEDIKDKALALKAQKGVPNGILFYGPPGTGKTYIANKIGEHLKQFGTNFVNLQIFGSNPEALDEFKNTVKNAKDNFEKTGKYTVILLNDLRKLLRGNSEEFDYLLNSLEKAKESGVIFVLTVNDPKEVNTALLRNGRLDMKMPIGEMQNFENSDMINFALHAFDETKKYAEKFDIQKVVEKMKKEKWVFTPAEFMEFARLMSNSKIVTEDEMIELMGKLASYDKKAGMYWNALTDDVLTNFNNDKEYVKNLDKKQNNDK